MHFTVYSPVLQAGWTGSLETLGQSSSSIRGEEENEFLMWGDAHYINASRDTEFNLLFTQQIKDRQETEIYQLFVSREFSSTDKINIGRFQKSDMSGFYIIDGILFNSRADKLNFNLYAGKPKRLEGFSITEGTGIAGADLFIPPHEIKVSGRQSFTATHQHKLSVQHQQDEISVSQTNLQNKHLDRIGLTSQIIFQPQHIAPSNSAFYNRDVEVNGALSFHLQTAAIENLYFKTALPLSEKLLLDLSVKHNSYPNPAIDFKSQFYKLFNRGEQSEVQSSLYFSPRAHEQHAIEIRYIQREVGDEGEGLAFNSEFSWSQLRLKSRLEFFDFMDQDHAGIYLNIEHALGSFSKIALGSVFRVQQSQLRHTTQVYGVEARWDWKIERDLLFYCSAELINQDRFDDFYNLRTPNDDYRFSVSLTKYWDTPWTP